MQCTRARPLGLTATAPSTPRPVGARASARGLRVDVVAFREDNAKQTSITQDVKRGGKRVQQKGRNVAQQGKAVVQRNARQVSQGLRDQDPEEVVENNSTVYGVNTVVLGLAAGLASYNPSLAGSLFFQNAFLASSASAGGALMVPLLQIFSLGLSAAAVTNYVQSGGATLDELDTTLHKRLNASLSTFSLAQLALLGLNLPPLSSSILGGYQGSSVLNTTGIAALGVGVLIQLYVAGVNYAAKKNPDSGNWSFLLYPVADAKSWFKDASNTFNGLSNSFSAGYAVLSASLLAAGLGYIVAPGLTLQGVFGTSAAGGGGPDAIILWQLIGAAVATIVAPMAYSLKEAAATNSLSDVRFKLLNIALVTAGVGHWLVLQPRLYDSATAGPLLPVVLGTWALAVGLGGVNLLQGREQDA